MSARVMIVDDEFHIVVPLQLKFTKAGYEVITAMDGDEAWEEIQKRPPDLLIADVLMPNMNGYELVEKIRKDPLLADLPVVFLTATAVEQKTREWAAEKNVAEVIAKPYSVKEVIRTVERMLESSGAVTG
ncbi:MAG: response regulator [Planctomycetales bacterium]|nr:response regulator [Planctomycetales bacterium]NIM09635.1 response regulator [Planctomycetales bacterium]NIN09118.1 response regulator [Planctomycetales bacterium]NIN78225.1 response regulator [Planctomycetales bacterium]NIO35416.1 response regulator [Planctomycetales bacterium]